MGKYSIILASKSPRRREILGSLGLKFEIVAPECDESSQTKDPGELVCELALRKANACKRTLEDFGRLDGKSLIIASDTVVVLDDRILGKPKNVQEARQMVCSLSGREHKVISSVALMTKDAAWSDFEVTSVCFDKMSDEEIDYYISTGESMDKAGGYAVQGIASLFISSVKGDYHSVVGLPVNRLNKLLKSALNISLPELI